MSSKGDADMNIERFDITSEGLRPNLIGRSKTDIDAVLGEGRTSRQGILKREHGINYPAAHARAAFRDGHTVEIGFAPPAPIFFKSERLFEHPELWREIAALDRDARESLGFIILPKLGITLAGFQDGDVSQRALTVFEQGRWDEFEA